MGGPKNFSAVGVGGGITEEAVQSLHRVGRGRSLLRGQGTGGGQETRVDRAAIIELVPYSYLEVFGLGGGGWRGGVNRCGRLGFTGPIRGRSVDKGGGGVGNTMGSEAGKKGLDIVRIRDSESAVKTVMR